LDNLPWDAVTPVDVGSEHPEIIDEKLLNAIASRALGGAFKHHSGAKGAASAFLYLYMILAHEGERYVPFYLAFTYGLSNTN
jgi:hypothetical protein